MGGQGLSASAPSPSDVPQTLNLRANRLRTISGLACCTALRHLEFYENQIERLQVAARRPPIIGQPATSPLPTASTQRKSTSQPPARHEPPATNRQPPCASHPPPATHHQPAVRAQHSYPRMQGDPHGSQRNGPFPADPASTNRILPIPSHQVASAASELPLLSSLFLLFLLS